MEGSIIKDEAIHGGAGGIHNQCIHHHHHNNHGGGICAFCLQEKLGKLVSSSSSSSPSPSFRSNTATLASSSSSVPSKQSNPSEPNHHQILDSHYKHSRIPFLIPNNKPKTKTSTTSSSSSSAVADAIFKRSKSSGIVIEEESSPRKRNRFWSFLYHPSSSSSSSKKMDSSKSIIRDNKISSETEHREKYGKTNTITSCSFENKVSRSRSVGCGGSSRSFSGDFFERISNGFGDCSSTLRRVESQREGGKPINNNNHHQCMIKGRVSCGGIFGGFMMMNNNSNSNASSSYRGWVFASPVRAFSTKTFSSSNKEKNNDHNNGKPNLSAIPSLLTVTS